MQVSYKRDMNHNYLILDPEEQIFGNEYQIRMLSINDIRGLLKCNMKKMDGKVYFYYEVTSRQSLERIFEKSTMSMEDIKALLLGVKSSIENVSAYLLEPDHVLLNSSYIYMDIETKEPSLCYLPSYKGNITNSFKELAEFILKRLDHNDPGAVALGYDIYRQTTEENFSIDQIIQSVYRQQTSSDLSLNGKSDSTGQPVQPGVKNEMTSEAYKNQKKLKEIIEKDDESPFIDTTDPELKKQIKSEKEEGKLKKETALRKYKDKDIKKHNEVKEKGDKSFHYNRKKDVKMEGNGNRAGSGRKIWKKLDFKLNFIIVAVTVAAIVGIFAAGSYLEADMTQLGGIVFFVLGGVGYLISFINRKKPNKIEKTEKEKTGSDSIMGFLKESKDDAESEYDEEINMSGKGRINGNLKTTIESSILSVQTDLQEDNQEEQEEQIGKTTILCGNEELKKLCFISMEPRIRGNILLYEEALYIGKMKSKVDVRIDLPVVSRVHAKVWKEDGIFYVMDLNSMNGTFLNGERLEANEKREIRPSDEVAFATASYYIGR